LGSQVARAALYNATAVLGQLDLNGNQSYLQSGPNSGPGPLGFHVPDGESLDTVNHRLFVVDDTNCRIKVYQLDANDNIVTSTPSYVLGVPNFLSKRPTVVSQSQMACSYGTTAYDSANQRLFYGDGSANRVMVFNVATSTLANGENASYVLGQSNFASSTAATTQSGMNSPSGLAFDPVSQRLFVGEYLNNRVLVFNVATSTIANGENASYVLGQSSFTSSTAAGETQSGMSGPTDLGFDVANQRLFVGDKFNNRVMVFNVATSTIANGENASYVLGQSSFTSFSGAVTQSTLGTNPGVQYDPNNQRLFVADRYNNRVMVFNVATSTIANGENASYVLGQSNFASSTAATTQSGMHNPVVPAYDPTDDHVFVEDQGNNRVLVFNVATSTIANGENALAELGQYDQYGNQEFTTGGPNNNAPAATAQGLSDPEGNLALDPVNNRLFVGDSLNGRVLVFQLDSNNNITTTAPSYVLGQSNFASSTFAATQNGLGYLEGVEYDPINQRLFVVDFNYNRVMVFNVATSTIANGENASYVLGQSNFTSNTATTSQSGLLYPVDASFDPINQRLFVADNSNHRVMVFNVATSTIANGENASYVLGQSNFTSNTATTTQSGLYNAVGTVYDSVNQRLFVADNSNHRVMVFNVATSTIANGENAENVLGQSNFTSNTGATTQSGLNGVFGGLAYDPIENRLLVTDYKNNRVMVFNVATSTIANGENAENVLGQSNFTSNTGATTQNGLSEPLGLAYDPVNKHLFVDDDGNNRVLQLNFISLTTPSLPAAITNYSYSTILNTTSSQGTVSFALFSGSFPPGLSLNTSSGVISGTPTTTGTSTFTIEADDNFSTGDFFDQATYALQVGNLSALIISPTNSATVSGTVNVTATTTSTFGIASIQFYLDSSPLGAAVTASSSPNTYTTTWNTTGSTNGSHTLLAVATDNNGNVATSSPVTVTVNNVVSSGGGGGGSVYYSLSLATSGSGSGTITGAGLTCGPNCSEGLISSQTVSLTASAGTNFVFAGWGGACANAGTGTVCSLTMTTDRTVSAVFNLANPSSEAVTTNPVSTSSSTTATTVVPPTTSVPLPSPISLAIPIRLVDNSGTFYLIINGVSHGVTDPGMLNSYGLIFSNAVPATAQDISLPQGSLLTPDDGALVKTAQDPTIYLVSGQQRHGFASASVFLGLGFHWVSVLTVTAPELNQQPIGTIISDPQSQHLPGLDINKDGTIYYIGQDNQLHGYPSLAAYNSWHIANDFSVVVPANAADMALPVGNLVSARVLQ